MLPGSVPKNPIVLGNPDNRPAQPATLLVDMGKMRAGRPVFVSGDGVEQAALDGQIRMGTTPLPATQKAVTAPNPPPPYYVQTEPTKYVGFKNIAAAERYAKTVGGTVFTRAEVLGEGAP